LLRSTRNSIL